MINLETLSEKELLKKRREILSKIRWQSINDGIAFSNSILKFELEDYIDDIVDYHNYLEDLCGIKINDVNYVLLNYALNYVVEHFSLNEIYSDELVSIYDNYMNSSYIYDKDTQARVKELLLNKKNEIEGNHVVDYFLYKMDIDLKKLIILIK